MISGPAKPYLVQVVKAILNEANKKMTKDFV